MVINIKLTKTWPGNIVQKMRPAKCCYSLQVHIFSFPSLLRPWSPSSDLFQHLKNLWSFNSELDNVSIYILLLEPGSYWIWVPRSLIFIYVLVTKYFKSASDNGNSIQWPAAPLTTRLLRDPPSRTVPSFQSANVSHIFEAKPVRWCSEHYPNDN